MLKISFIRKALIVLIISLVTFTLVSVSNNIGYKSFGATYIYTKTSNTLPEDFDVKYPGYKQLAEGIVSTHPNWNIQFYQTGLQWEAVINSEYQGHGGSPKNLVSNTYGEAWRCSICGDHTYDTGRWYCASREAIKYMMDGRNGLNEIDIFQFLMLSNDSSITKEQVATMASKIAYLNKEDIINAICDVANEKNINPFYIIGKIIQEQGTSGSVLCLGQGYQGQYVGYYNFFNVGASGNTERDVILNGLGYAYNHGWDSPKAAILGGLGTITNYINRGQNTTYFQKYNVVYSPYYSYQYAQNIMDARSIGRLLKSYYVSAELLESNFTFIIPLYENMSQPPSELPTTPYSYEEEGTIAYVNADGGLALRDAPNGNRLCYIDNTTQVLITLRATEKIGGYYWDKVITPKGTGYMARENEDGTKTYLAVIKENVVETNNNYSEPNSDNQIIAEPNVTVKKLRETYPEAIITNKDGEELSAETSVGTGAKIKIRTVSGEDKVFTIVKLGDSTGDGVVDAIDLLRIRKHLIGSDVLTNEFLKALDIYKDDKVDAIDLLKLRKFLTKTETINL